ncbi:MAG: UDP-N-acetylglucosamine diphosphorylase [Verrucomicrobia bacterium GWC2_42_7]|nr:MAG: UDP-N-acetylglucosamine diphosphorylase [Verrucomicrobia bacterium GWC2_42_7]
MKASQLFDLPKTLPFEVFFEADKPVWEWLPLIKVALENFDFSAQDSLKDIPPGVSINGKVYIHPTVNLPPFAAINGPAYIGAHTEIRPGCYIRGNVIVGEGCILGNSCEYKNCLLMDHVETPHYNYVGDSILGSRSHLGAGVILANLRLDRAEVKVKTASGLVSTGLRKFGAILGERAEVGCNAVIQPGSILGRHSVVMSTMAFSGILPDNHVALSTERTSVKPRK